MIYLAKVTSTKSNNGLRFYAVKVESSAEGVLEPVGDQLLITYTTPYWSLGEGGFLASPQVDSIILIAEATNGGHYYVQSIPDYKSLSSTDSKLTRATGSPMRKSFKGDRGAGLEIYDELSSEMQNVGVGLVTGGGKYLKLVDSPGVDHIEMNNGLGDILKLTRKPQSGVMSTTRSLLAKIWGSITIFCRTGRLLIQNQDGGNIDILNNSKGQYAASTSEKKKHGNVNIQSSNADVNLYALGEEGRIFIECLNKSSGTKNIIQFSTQGTGSMIRIDSAGDVEISSGGKMKLSSKGTMTFEGSNFDFKTGAKSTGKDKSTFSDTGVIPT